MPTSWGALVSTSGVLFPAMACVVAIGTHQPQIRLLARSITHAGPVNGTHCKIYTSHTNHLPLRSPANALPIVDNFSSTEPIWLKCWMSEYELTKVHLPGLLVRVWSASQVIRMRRSTSWSRCQCCWFKMSQILHDARIATFNLSGDQSEVPEEQDGPNIGGDKEVYTREGKLRNKISS